MALIKILGVDPSLRSTGLAVVTYDTQTQKKEVKHCQVILNPQKYKGTEAILNMLDMIKEISKENDYIDVDSVIVESPPIMFNKTWSSNIVSLLAHVSGGAIALLGLEKGYLFSPSEWNGRRKKEVTHRNTVIALGDPKTWHFQKKLKAEKYMEHVLDAVSMALWWINQNYDVEQYEEEAEDD
jgi:hypothetical protein